MSEFKVGDKLISKLSYNSLTLGKQYRINRINITTDTYYVEINDDRGQTWHYDIDDKNSGYYYADYFYTKSELRDMKLKELGI
jgi:hypothetical protein